MSDFSNLLAVSASGMRAQSDRLRITSENIANADTPGFRRKLLPFQEVMNLATGVELVKAGKVKLDTSDLPRIFSPDHPLADESGHYNGSNVDLIVEIADARESQRSYEANLRMFDQARQMASSALELLRR